MNKDFYINFLSNSEKAVKESQGAAVFQKHADNLPFVDSDSAAKCLHNAQLRTIENLDEELNRFEKNFANKHNSVFWASDFNDVFSSLKQLFKTHKVKSVRLPNVKASTIFRELGIKYFLKEEKISLADDADMQFFAVDMMVADTGSLLFVNQSNNSLSKLSNNRTNVFFVTVDHILPNASKVEVYQQLVSYHNGAAQQDMFLFKGSPNCNNYLFIIDNQRSTLLKEKQLRQSMTCLQCGRCSDVCPVFQTIGEEPYNNVFTGPVANIMLPWLETIESYRHVLYTCTLCGRCEEVCPVDMPIRDMILDARHSFFINGQIDKKDKKVMSAMRKTALSRSKMNASSMFRRRRLRKFLSSDFRRRRKTPPLSKETFNRLFMK
ncbi:MAG: lactate utilization protein [Bacteroidales bacterium]|nr:lactate utilization protein [Bacteroidales bacterium]